MPTSLFGCIEAGGTKFVCAVGSGPEDLAVSSFPTTTPAETLEAVADFFRKHPPVAAIGIASFGPVDLNSASPTYGYITATPKAGWRNCDLAGEVARALRVPVGLDTDVNGAALGEARWGAGRRLSDFLYLTIGTGIGGGAIAGGRLIHGLVHPEMGHIRIPHDVTRDPFPGSCPFHGDCLEGLASGPAMQARWGVSASELAPDHPAWTLEAHYIAVALANWVCTLSPQRIILGGGVMQQEHLFPLIRRELQKLLNGYIQAPALLDAINTYVVPPQLGSRAGVLGALVLAEQALAQKGTQA